MIWASAIRWQYIIVTRVLERFPIRIGFISEFIAFHNCYKYVISPLLRLAGRGTRDMDPKMTLSVDETGKQRYLGCCGCHSDDCSPLWTLSSLSVVYTLTSLG